MQKHSKPKIVIAIYSTLAAFTCTDAYNKSSMTGATRSSFGAGVLGDRFGALGHCVLGQLPGQQQPDRGLHLSAGDGGTFVVLSQPGRLRGDPLKQVVHEGVHDAHGSARNPRIRVNLGDGTRVISPAGNRIDG